MKKLFKEKKVDKGIKTRKEIEGRRDILIYAYFEYKKGTKLNTKKENELYMKLAEREIKALDWVLGNPEQVNFRRIQSNI